MKNYLIIVFTYWYSYANYISIYQFLFVNRFEYDAIKLIRDFSFPHVRQNFKPSELSYDCH
jgi:hypothetical protein